ncbi:MAG TPA: radical SAM protein [Caulobacteraceae bacterium]|jgi:uncharacterized protein
MINLRNADVLTDVGVIPDNARLFTYTLIKLAMRCNLDCTYCYWFRDKSVYERPALLTLAAEDAYVGRLTEHIRRYGLKTFSIIFHGGEPLLFGKRRFDSFCRKLRQVEREENIALKLSLTSNGVLVDREWADLFKRHNVRMTISIDGPKNVHDAVRKDLRGRGTLQKTVDAFHLLREMDVSVGVLAVCDPQSDPFETCEYFVEELEIRNFDILIPDANHESPPPSIAAYYKRLFELWYDRYAPQGVEIRLMESITKGLLGANSRSESLGYGPATTATLLTDGSLEPLDVLRTAGYQFTKTNLNVFEHDLQALADDPLYQEVLRASLRLAPECRACQYHFACGGGHIASRWSTENRFDNPSVYCDDFKQIFDYAWRRIRSDLQIETGDGLLPLTTALSENRPT